MSDALVRVHPIDKNGQNLETVYLCPNCRAAWGKVYDKEVKNVDSIKFQSAWTNSWENFMSGKYEEREVVQFT
jgi:hypothetical protein